jgi:hypothetical protein
MADHLSGENEMFAASTAQKHFSRQSGLQPGMCLAPNARFILALSQSKPFVELQVK